MSNRQIHPETLKTMKDYFKPGTRVRLTRMSDSYANVPQGTTGTVTCVDDIGTIHVNWDNGSSLGVVFGEDACTKI